MYQLLRLVLPIIFISSCSGNMEKNRDNASLPEMTFPGATWEEKTPGQLGIDPVRMHDALDTLKKYCGDDGIKEVLLVRNGYIIFKGDSVTNTHSVWSTSKTFTSTCLLLLEQEGKCSINDYAAVYEPLLRGMYDSVKLHHFATMTSGYSARGKSRWDGTSEDWSATQFSPDTPLFAPGKSFAYWDEAQMMFGRVLTQIAGQSLHSLLTERITGNIGIGTWEWWDGGDSLEGIPLNNGCTGVHVNALQLARWGHLFLNKGNWNGEQLIDEDLVLLATSNQVDTTVTLADTDRKSANGIGCYGFNWWTNGIVPGGERAMPDSPRQLFYGSGLNNNMVFVVPEWNMVLVRMGLDPNPPEGKAYVYNLFFRELGKAILGEGG